MNRMDETVCKARAEAILSAMTLPEKVGQMFVVRRPQDDDQAMQAVTQYHLGGFTLYACDFEHRDPESIRTLLKSYQEVSPIPMFIAADEEGGRVVRASKYPAFRPTPFPSPRELFAAGGYEAVEQDTKEKAALLLDLGVNFNYAPVCDMSGNPDTFIFDRTFGNDPAATARYTEIVVRTMNDCNLVGSIKHFPGYGDNVDTHTSIAHDDRSMEQFLTRDLAPFVAGIKAGAPIVMVAHNIVSCMDPDVPASLSPTVHSLLRDQLGFTGIIMTDSLDMNAITLYTHDRASAVQAVLSGNDLLCCSTYDRQVPAVLDAVADGTISEESINQSVRRILELKLRMGILQG
jgi:beta-N-acetylhexosaminidase